MTAASVPDCELCALLAGDDDSVVWSDGRVAVILADEPAYPGFCRVLWHGHVKEMTDLAPVERNLLMAAVWQVEAAVREVMVPDKVNLASLGNMVPHLHWHVIPRYVDDAQFPAPVWAVVQRVTPSAMLAQRAALLPRLRTSLVQRLGAINDL
jgi:diadenosine tetraphosphate (Ap4A) HIT family hydrolase